jgi:hypothetical protein
LPPVAYCRCWIPPPISPFLRPWSNGNCSIVSCRSAGTAVAPDRPARGPAGSHPMGRWVDQGQSRHPIAHLGFMRCKRHEPGKPASPLPGYDRPQPPPISKQLRLQEARQLLLAGEHSASDVAFAVGYESASSVQTLPPEQPGIGHGHGRFTNCAMMEYCR